MAGGECTAFCSDPSRIQTPGRSGSEVVLCDFAITTCMILSLRPSQSHFSSNKSTLVKLTRLTIETGLVTTVAALLELILGIVYKQYMYHVALFYAISKLNQSNPNLTAIVWDDMTLNPQSTQPGYQPPRIAQILARVGPEVEAIELNNQSKNEWFH
ncbi:hypothetical protein J3R83DRAFT_11171 [Lanmaoa asiatica]|nr:hypothetical protein J3R83DRAFT_11171 [Lanmaoa asiatica]